ncbi:MAG TPA: SGNH/GDSL hydrolase family protein [bacterium]
MRMVGFGDSITAGFPGFRSPVESPPYGAGDEQSQYAYWMMRRRPDWRVLNRGLSGERTDEMLRRFDRDVASARPDLVIVLGGINDLVQAVGPAGVITQLDALYARADEAGIVAAGVTLLPLTGATDRFASWIGDVNAWILEACRRGARPCCDLFRIMSEPGIPGALRDSDDGVHPNVGGYRRIGEALADAIGEWQERPGAAARRMPKEQRA